MPNIHEKSVGFNRKSSTISGSTAQIIYLGNIYGEHIHDGYGGAVFSKYGLCPAITTCQGGNRQPMIVEEYEGKN